MNNRIIEFLTTPDYITTSEAEIEYSLFHNCCFRTNKVPLVRAKNYIEYSSDLEFISRLRQCLYHLTSISKRVAHIKVDRADYMALRTNIEKQIVQFIKALGIVDELLSNCQEGPSNILYQLKQQYYVISPIHAERAAEVNVKMLGVLLDQITGHILPSIENVLAKYMDKYQEVDNLMYYLRIAGTQILMINLIISSCIDMDHNDLLSLEKDHTRWQRLFQITEVKTLGRPEQILESYETFVKSVSIGHALVNDFTTYDNKFISSLLVMFGGMYYTLRPKMAHKQAQRHISNIQVRQATMVMGFIDLPGVKHFLKMGYPKIRTNIKFYIDPVVLPITIESMNREIRNKTIDQITQQNIEYVNEEIHASSDIFQKNKSKLRIRLLYNQEIFQDGIWKYVKSIFQKPSYQQPNKIIIHIHGGGFISQSSSCHQSYTRDWSIDLNVPIFSIDYSLAPQYPYPRALDDCWQAYHWILRYSEQVFGISPKKIILAGDSAGGNICFALAGLLVKYGSRIPDGLVLSYPAIDIRYQFTPSYMKSIQDKILTHTILGICIESYSADERSQLGVDPFMNPIMLSNEILTKFPPVRLCCGTNDPLVDQVHRVSDRLLDCGVDIKIVLYEGLSHGYMNFNTIKGMAEIKHCIRDCEILIKNLMQ